VSADQFDSDSKALHAQVRDDADLEEAKAKGKEIEAEQKKQADGAKAAADAQERLKMQSSVTGLINYPDGHREFVEGGRVDGVNQWLGTTRSDASVHHKKSHKKKGGKKRHHHLNQKDDKEDDGPDTSVIDEIKEKVAVEEAAKKVEADK
jgi:hypothetical protein